MNISINAVFRKDRLNSQNAAPVHLRLTQNRKLKHISTGVTLNINEWDFENQRVKGQTPELQALQLRIDTKISSVMDYFEIFLKRMLLCRKAAEKLGLKFRLTINGQTLL